MLRQKCSYKNDIETRKMRKSKKKKKKCNESLQFNKNKSKVSYLLKMVIYNDLRKKFRVTYKKLCCFFERF